jgi:uncharacterized protein YjiS (DUF1127 family)
MINSDLPYPILSPGHQGATNRPVSELDHIMTTLKIVSILETKENQEYSYFGTIAAVAMRAVLWPVRVARTRKVMNQLATMSAHELRDIGLAPHDIESAQALRLDEDPTRFLADRARERALSRQERLLKGRYY